VTNDSAVIQRLFVSENKKASRVSDWLEKRTKNEKEARARDQLARST
jgi:hypothetical protein